MTGVGRGARTAASFWVFLTLGATDFFGVANVDFFGTGLRTIAFFAGRCFAAAFFLITVFRLLFNATFALAVLRTVAFWATARFAFGRAALGLDEPRFAAALGADR